MKDYGGTIAGHIKAAIVMYSKQLETEDDSNGN